MSKVEFSSEAIAAAVTALGIDLRNTTAFLADADQCRALIRAVEGDGASVKDDPVSIERYRKRAERMLAELTAARAGKTSADSLSEHKITLDEVMRGKKSRKTKPKTAVAKAGTGTDNNASVAAAATTPPAKSGTAKETTMAKTKTAAKAKKAPKVKADKKPGVIDTIVAVLKDGGGTIKEIAAKVAKKFPDREADGILATTKIQMNRLQGEPRNLKIKATAQEGTNEKTYKI